MSNITITQETGAMRITVVKTQRLSPHFQRVTFTGEDLARLKWRGFDQWGRLFLPTEAHGSLSYVPQKLTTGSYLKMLTVPSSKRPIIRNYTLRQWRPEELEVDIDFVIHGDRGVAGPWAQRAKPGDELMMIDQGCGWPGTPGAVVIAADETALPAALGILRDLPSDATGLAIIEVSDAADIQESLTPPGVDLRWVIRHSGLTPGTLALEELIVSKLPDGPRHAFGIGESRLATGLRRHLVKTVGWDKSEVSFCGYWKYKPAT